MVDVMLYEVFEEEEAIVRKKLPRSVNARYTWKTIQEYNNKTLPAELISVRTQSRIPKGWAAGIKGILTRSQGYDHLLSFRRDARTNIQCGYLGNYCARAVAEQAILTMLTLMRKLKNQIKNFESFNRDGLTGLECRGRNVFVVGVGHIGGEIIDIARGLRMNIKGFDVEEKVRGLTYVDLAEGINWADVVFCALPLTEQTDGLLNYKVIKKAKPGLIFVNIARGEISPIKDLKRLLDEHVLGGLGLDVYPEEPTLALSLRSGKANVGANERIIRELSKREQVLFTPHNAFNTREALEQKASLSADAVVHYLEKGTFPCPVPSV